MEKFKILVTDHLAEEGLKILAADNAVDRKEAQTEAESQLALLLCRKPGDADGRRSQAEDDPPAN